MTRHKVTLVSIATASVLLTVVFLEAISFYLISRQKGRIEILKTPRNTSTGDPLLGYKPRPNGQVHVIKKRNDRLVYRVDYAFDEHSRRIAPHNRRENKTRFILFFGGSVTFGEGVNQDETLPSYVAGALREFRAYNYGYKGYGTQHMLVKLQNQQITTEITEKEGILVYVFIDNHINRAIGSMQTTWGRRFAYYTVNLNGELILKGNFQSGRPYLTPLYDLLSKSYLLRYLKLDFPKITDKHIRLTARIIAQSNKAFREKFHSDQFYVLFFPRPSSRHSPHRKRLMSYLGKLGVSYLDYPHLMDHVTKHRIVGDGHPTPEAYKAVARRLVKDISPTRDD